jgi:hypothetical protein
MEAGCEEDQQRLEHIYSAEDADEPHIPRSRLNDVLGDNRLANAIYSFINVKGVRYKDDDDDDEEGEEVEPLARPEPKRHTIRYDDQEESGEGAEGKGGSTAPHSADDEDDEHPHKRKKRLFDRFHKRKTEMPENDTVSEEGSPEQASVEDLGGGERKPGPIGLGILSWLVASHNREIDGAIETVNLRMLDRLVEMSPLIAVAFLSNGEHGMRNDTALSSTFYTTTVY